MREKSGMIARFELTRCMDARQHVRERAVTNVHACHRVGGVTRGEPMCGVAR